ncbi:MAG TPA: DUF1223 domain-containing protein [Alphaproteobacteria bacterium]|nr:DUF1223 domain-containing protein [Alphaproteobacteria bacterium]
MIRIRILAAGLLLTGMALCPFGARAQDRGGNAPLPAPAVMPAAPQEPQAPQDGPLILELFSSEICMFCPAAETLLAERLQQENTIGLTCMVDYLQTRADGPGRAFCSARQAWYARVLGTGPIYTPQIVINGRTDAVGHRPPSLDSAIAREKQTAPAPVLLDLRPDADAGGFSVQMPGMEPLPSNQAYSVTLAVYRDKQDLVQRSGPARALTHAVNDLKTLDPWDGQTKTLTFPLALKAGEGAVLIVQNPVTGAIVAAGSAPSMGKPSP